MRCSSALVFLFWAMVVFGENAIEPRGRIGVLENPIKVDRLVITKPGTYENFLVDSRWQGGNRVKVTCDDVVTRNCEIRNATGNGIGVFGERVLIEKCRIHHLLAGSYDDQRDAHGITGQWGDVIIRDCDVSYVSGDSYTIRSRSSLKRSRDGGELSFMDGPVASGRGEVSQGATPRRKRI